MAISVRDLSVHSLFQNDFLIVAGFDGLSNMISYVSVIDTPLIPAPSYKLENGVFVLSSLYLYRDNPEQIVEAVKNLVQIGASAIGVKTDLFVHTLPKDVLDFCNDAAIPLFQINNKDIPFRKVISVVEEILRSSDGDSVFFDGLLSGNINSVFHNMAREVMSVNFVCVTTGLDVIVKYFPNARPDSNSLIQSAREVLSRPDLTESLKTPAGYLQLEHLYAFPCYVYNTLEAVIVFEYPSPIGLLMQSKIKNLAGILSLQLYENILLEKGRLSAIVNRTADYLLDEYPDENTARMKFELLNFPPQANYRLVLFNYREPVRPASYYSEHYIRDTIEQRMVSLFPKSIFFNANPNLIFLVPVSDGSKHTTDRSFRRALEDFLADSQMSIPFDILYTELQRRLSHISMVYRHLVQVAKSGFAGYEGDDSIRLVRSFDAVSLLSPISPSYHHWVLRETVITPLLQYDEQYHSELWLTLEVCMKSDKLEPAASKLHIHSSTLRYRLQKIEALTGYSYFNLHDRIVLYFAYLLHTIEH